MIEFLELNKQKIFFGLKWTSIISTSIVLLIFGWEGLYGRTPALNLFISVLLGAGIGFPIFSMVLGVLSGYLEFRRTNQILNTYPFSELLKIGFQRVSTNQKNKWVFSQIMLHRHFDGYPVDCEVESGVFKIIVLINRDNFKKVHMEKLKIDFGKDKVAYDWLGIALGYNVKKERLLAFGQLRSDLDRFVQFFKNEGLDPWDKPWE